MSHMVLRRQWREKDHDYSVNSNPVFEDEIVAE